MSAALLLAVSLLAATPAGDLEDEHAQLQDRLEAEKTLFDSLGSEKKNLLTLLDTLERLARESTDRSAKLERTLKKVTRQVAEASAEAEADQRALAEQQAQLRPRLASLYRLHRQDTLGTLLSSTDFSTLIKRQRALKTLVASELAALDDLALLERRATFQEHRLERLQTTAQRYVRALRSEQAVGQARLSRFKELLASVNAEQNRRSRVIAELEASEKELSAMVAEMNSSGSANGFRGRKGQMPFPTHGIVEVGFGKVVNPRFNTVTVQKGIDVRAPEGREVASVCKGAVVFSGWLKGYGNLVIIDHGGGYHSLYAHLSSSQVDVGATVEEGEILGLVGDTGSLKGPYLYFEIRKGGQAIDPQPWLKQDE